MGWVLGIGLSLGFCLIFMGLVSAEFCYLRLKWKKPSLYSSKTQKISFPWCWKRPEIVISRQLQLTNSQPEEEDVEIALSKFDYDEESEMMSIHNLCGPPRFLFTIKEESNEDLESARSSICKGLNDGNSTPSPSPPFKGSNLPVLESMTEAEMNRLRTSPPPTFKFLKDAEDKFILMQEAERIKRGLMNGGVVQECGVGEGNDDVELVASPNFQTTE